MRNDDGRERVLFIGTPSVTLMRQMIRMLQRTSRVRRVTAGVTVAVTVLSCLRRLS